MQSIELYNPVTPNLHLTPFTMFNSSSEDVNPLNYQLTADDFIALKQPDSQLFYFLDPSTTTSLFWALNRLAQHITRAASHGLYSDSTIPFVAKGHIPQIYFDRINMLRPDILNIQDQNFLNPLYGYTTRENLAAWYCDFQTLGRLAVQWIQTAQRQTLQLGPGTGWDWEARHGPRLEYPTHHLITNYSTEMSQWNSQPNHSPRLIECNALDDNDLSSDAISEYGMDDESGFQSDEGLQGSTKGEGSLVLHPVKSAYAIRYPDFNPFAGRPLIDNGYIDANNNECRAVIVHPSIGLDQERASVDYLNTTFTVLNSDMEG